MEIGFPKKTAIECILARHFLDQLNQEKKMRRVKVKYDWTIHIVREEI